MVTITSFIGYAQLYKNGVGIYRIPVFESSGSVETDSSIVILQDISNFNAVFLDGSLIAKNTTVWDNVIKGNPPPPGTIMTSADGLNAITFYGVIYSSENTWFIASKTTNGNELGTGSSFDSPNFYPIIINNPLTNNYVPGAVSRTLDKIYINNSILKNYTVDLEIYNTSKDITNFYRSSPEGDIIVSRGETINLEFTAVYEDGSTKTPYTDVVYSELPPESVATFSGNSFTISENCRASIFTAIAKPNIGETSLYAFVQAKISNPVDPYLPDGGGISGGGSQSGSSNVIGSFDGTPGPSIEGNLQVGASGSDIASSGMYTKYLCNNAQLNVLAQLFWEDNIGIQAVKALFGDPINSIISLVSYPFALDNLVPTKSTTFYLGKYNSLLAATAITKSSFQINWGEIEIPFFWGSFLDYAPYTKIQLYLPWGTGFVSLDPNEVMPFSANNSYTQGSFTKGKISVRTNIELDKGACVHSVIGNNGRIIGSFGGVVGKQIPMTGVDASGKVFALFGAAVAVGTTAALAAGGYPSIGKGFAYGSGMSTMNRATGREMLGEYKSAVSSALASSAALAKAPISYPRAGTFSDATNTLGYQYPYLIISRPSQSVSKKYGRFMGYPSNIFHNYLSEVRGYTEVASIHLDNIPATSSELEELESILKGGVIL